MSRAQNRAARWAIALFATAILVQLGHEAEHFVQIAQAKLHHHGPPHGLFGSVFDTEWVHFGYNVILLAILAAVLFGYGRGGRRFRRPSTGMGMFLAGVVLQGYHVVEHSVKIAQHVATGAAPTPGILGHHLDLIWLHFTFNLLVTAAMLSGAVSFGVPRSLMNWVASVGKHHERRGADVGSSPESRIGVLSGP